MRDDREPPDHAPGPAPTLVVGVGASAGGLDACKRLLARVPADRGLAFVVVMHLAPSHDSHVADILTRDVRLKVTQVSGGERVEANHVYVIAPDTSLRIQGGVLHAGEPEEPHFRARPIDDFLSSLATDCKERAAGIVLSGSGTDGSEGLARVRAAGGLCLAQDPHTAQHPGMPTSAIDAGIADAVLPPEDMGQVLLEYAEPPHRRPAAGPEEGAAVEEPAVEEPEALDEILGLLGRQYRIDFRDYRIGTLQRRTRRRMGLKQITDWQEYLEYLRKHPEEVEALYGDLLIEVTGFFRDRETWDYLEREVVPDLLAKHDAERPVRVWSAGCATGEEAYGLAMVFLDQLERQPERIDLHVFASDVSHGALSFARRGFYPSRIAEDVSPERLRRFFRRADEGFQVERTVRERVTFADHDMLSDPPFPSLDLVSCRNVLIYLEPRAQERLLELFHFSLRPDGFLWLGGSEAMGRRSDLFEPVSKEHRLFRAVGQLGRAGPRPGRGSRPQARRFQGPVPEPVRPAKGSPTLRPLEQFVLQRHTAPSVAINRNLEILHFFGATDAYLTRPPGEARMDVLSWLRPGLYTKLRAGLLQAVDKKERVTVRGMRIQEDATTAGVEATVEPVTTIPGANGVFLVVFRDAPKQARADSAPAAEARSDEPIVRQLEEELRDTRHELQNTVEELESSNEEYRASHEELLSLNEELQSSNEELESSKEELQSLNEELTMINRQLEERNAELSSLTSEFNNLLVSAGVPTIFLDRQLRIRRFTPACTELMRIVPTDVGRPLAHVKMRVQDDALFADAERVLEHLTPIEAEVSIDSGRWFVRTVRPYRTEDERIDGVCVTFHEITAQKRAAIESEEERAFAEAMVRSSRTPLLILDSGLEVISASRAFFDTFQVREEDTVGTKLYDLASRQWDIPELRTMLEERLPRERDIRAYEIDHEFESIGWRALRLSAAILERRGRTNLLIVSVEDVTDLRQAEAAARKRAQQLAEDHRRKDEFLAMLGHELRNPLTAIANGVRLIRMTGDASHRVQQVGTMLERQTQRITAMLDQLLDMGRVVSGKLELSKDAVDIVEAIDSALETTTPAVEQAGQKLTLSLPPRKTLLVLGDGVRLAQIVENLLSNATKHTASGGQIWVTASATGETVRIAVRDTGVGMDPEVLDHAFDLFTQSPRRLDRAQGGLGLGLPLVRTLVEMHGGHVEARSPGSGQGSEFTVTLPRLRSGTVAQHREEEPAPSVRPREILVVDDEEDNAMGLVEILEIEGHRARAVGDGPGAIQAAREQRPEVVLLDLGLPGMDGYEVAARLREEHGDAMRIIAMTGYQRDDERLRESGFDEHVLKPPEMERLREILATDD